MSDPDNTKETFETRPDYPVPRAMNREHCVWNQCLNCNRWYAARSRRLERGQNVCCGFECWNKHAVKHGLLAGNKNPNWKGGVSKDNMRYRRRQKERHPVEEAARKAVARAVRSGRLVRQSCETCGATPAQGHHDDYSRPLDVRWLCRKCHDAHHAEAG